MGCLLTAEQRGLRDFGTVRQFALVLLDEARMYSCHRLDHILVRSLILYAP